MYDENATGWSGNDRGGETQTFGHDVLEKFLDDNNLKMVVRAHQTCQNGFNLREDQKLVTVFPNQYREMENVQIEESNPQI